MHEPPSKLTIVFYLCGLDEQEESYRELIKRLRSPIQIKHQILCSSSNAGAKHNAEERL